MSDHTVLNWAVRVPLLRSPLILRQLGLAIGLPFGALLAVLGGLWLKTGDKGLLYAVLFILGFLLVGFGFALLLLRGVYDVEFTLDGKQALCATREQQARRVRRVSAAAMVLGLVTGNFSAAGAGALAGSRLKTTVTWKRVRRVRCAPKHRTITLNAGLGETMVLFCSAENYETVRAFVLAKTAESPQSDRRSDCRS